MNIVYYYRVELGRLVRSKITRLVVLLTLCCAAAPIALGISYQISTRFMSYIGMANQFGCLGGGLLFSLLTLNQLSAMYTRHADGVIEAVASARTLYISR